ncbi:eukaryotic mitochondrial regulator protein-domain-containing protein [Suillus paluster]|uniref:eukaryotic mitochondrial regulator protein-domain-containing protein n=1 Tax=Suillus paluster TaxID=48578 RepID=UPI001B87AFF7|nr:eukaryotic mitochondrial regulator protein-domain-containing protein [Suillus paluster]KAG1754770.1 eukaryotic mitochondrial regulator protein-domain-containing protein [Suillus paluster]
MPQIFCAFWCSNVHSFACQRRTFFQSFVARKDEFFEADEEDDALGQAILEGLSIPQDADAPRTPTYEKWIAGAGRKYRDPAPRNWLGSGTPFPLNQSFRPPPPVSDTLRTYIYRSYMANPEANSVRALAVRHHLSIKRVDAILRLKGLEESWKKEISTNSAPEFGYFMQDGKNIQTGFVQGMERLLGVHQAKVFTTLDDSKPVPVQYDTNQQMAKIQSDRYDVTEADREDDEAGGFDWARQRYQRMFWETVPEGKDPVMPGILDAATKSVTSTSENKTQMNIVERPGRPAIKFIDVGNMFLNVKDQERRVKEGERRAKVRARRKERQQMAN